jgi:hypothetical protein
MIASPPASFSLGAALPIAARLLWFSHGLIIFVAIASLQLFSSGAAQPDTATVSAVKPDLSSAPIVSAGPVVDVRPMAYIVCTALEMRQARAEAPAWASVQYALRGITDQAFIDNLYARSARGEIQLFVYCEP